MGGRRDTPCHNAFITHRVYLGLRLGRRDGMGMVFSRGQAGSVVPGVSWPQQRALTLRDDRRGVYRFDPRGEDFASFSRKGPYSFWGSMKYTFILSLMLWWIPLFGPMIAGYVGGRKAGNPWRGALAAVIPVTVIWILSLIVISSVEFPELQNLFTLPALILYGFGAIIPPIEPYMHFLVDYLSAFVVALQQTAVMGFNGYLVTIIFAYIGGLVAAQVAMERKVQAETQVPPVTYEMSAPVAPLQPVQPVPVMPAAAPAWYGVHPEQYDQYRRIPLTSPYEGEEDYYEPPRRPPRPSRLARRRPPPEEPYEPYEPEAETRPRQESPSRRRARRLRQDDLIRRLVERALRDYRQAIR